MLASLDLFFGSVLCGEHFHAGVNERLTIQGWDRRLY